MTRRRLVPPMAPAAFSTGQAAEDDGEKGQDGVEDGLADGDDAVHNGHDAASNGIEYRFNLYLPRDLISTFSSPRVIFFSAKNDSGHRAPLMELEKLVGLGTYTGYDGSHDGGFRQTVA